MSIRISSILFLLDFSISFLHQKVKIVFNVYNIALKNSVQSNVSATKGASFETFEYINIIIPLLFQRA